MTTYVEYLIDDETSILVEIDELDETGIVEAARDTNGNIIIKSAQKFGDALENIKIQAGVLREKFKDLQADEVEIMFSLTTTGELGNFAVGKIGIEANYEVTLKWQNK